MNALTALRWPALLRREKKVEHAKPKEYTDIELVQLAQKGHDHACEALFRRYMPRINRVVVRMLGDRPDVEDIVQEIFLKTFRSLKNYRAEAQFSTWVYRIATNTCLNYLKHQSVQGRHMWHEYEDSDDSSSWTDHQPTHLDGPESLMLRSELSENILKAIENLPSDQRVAVILRDIEGLSYEEIASILECPMGTLKSRIARGRVACQQRLAAYVR